MHFRVGKGDRVHFWLDPWCSPTPLYCAFPDLYATAMLKNGLVKEPLKRENEQQNYDLHLRRDANDGEVLPFSSLLSRLDRAVLGEEDEPDRRLWQSNAMQGFSVQSMYNIIHPEERLDSPTQRGMAIEDAIQFLFLAMAAAFQ